MSVKSILGGAIGFIAGGPPGAAIGAGIGGSMDAAEQQAQASQAAASTQAAAASEGVAEQRRQFNKLVELMSPYITAGKGAIEQQQALLGMGGEQAQQQAIGAIERSPFFASIAKQGENAILQQASATGGLRGGNVQAALGQFRPQLLNQLIQSQMANLGGLTQIGQASAAGQAAQGMQSAGNISNLLTQQGAAIAGGQLAQGQQMQNTLKTIGGLAGIAGGLGWKPF